MEKRDFTIEYSKEADQFVVEVGQLIEKPKAQEKSIPSAEKSEGLSKQEIQAILDDHFTKIEKMLSEHSKQIDQIPADKPEEMKAAKESFIKKIQGAFQDFKDTLKYLVGDMTDNVRLGVKNGINRRVLRINDKMKQLSEKIEKKFEVEKKFVRIDPREAKRMVAAAKAQQESMKKAPSVSAGTDGMYAPPPLTAANESKDAESLGKETDYVPRHQVKEKNQEKVPTSNNRVEVSKESAAPINQPRINQSTELSKQEVSTMIQEAHLNMGEVANKAFDKRANEPTESWIHFQEKFGDQDLDQAWNVFMRDTLNLTEELKSDQGKDLSDVWEKDYYDFFYEGGKQAYDAAVNDGVPLNYSAAAIQEFENLYDRHIAKAMQENLSDEIGIKQAITDKKNKPVKQAMQPTNKFEQRVAEAKIKNQLIEKSTDKTISKEAANDAPIMK